MVVNILLSPCVLVVLGVGRTVISYHAKEAGGMLSFPAHQEVKIFSKGAGTNPDLWGVMVSIVLLLSYLSQISIGLH